jgi:hypothetical protein
MKRAPRRRAPTKLQRVKSICRALSRFMVRGVPVLDEASGDIGLLVVNKDGTGNGRSYTLKYELLRNRKTTEAFVILAAARAVGAWA